MTRNHAFLLFFLIVLGVSSANAQSGIFEKLRGSWQGTGTVNKMESALTMKWEAFLSEKFYRLTFKNTMKSNKGDVVFEGMAMYKLPASSLETEGNWFDSFGFVRPIKAILAKDSLTANWGSKETEEGKTVYRLLENDKMEVVDSVKTKDGLWREFGRSNYVRIKE